MTNSRKEFWAEFDLYESLATASIRIRGLLSDIQRERDKDKKAQLNASLRQLQQEVRNKVTTFIFQGEVKRHVVLDFAARLSHLAQLVAVDCVCEGRTTQCKDYAKGKNGLQHWFYAGDLETPGGEYQSFLGRRLRWMGAVLSLANHDEDTVGPALPDLVSSFPPGSWAIQVRFTLRKPYLSKDDVDFYIIDNPVKKEWVFKVPYVAPSQWKGALRAAMMSELVEDLRSGQKDEAEFIQARLRLYRLFGNEKDGAADFLNRAWTLHRVGPRPEDEHQAQEWERKYKHTYAQVSREFEANVRDAGYRNENVEGFRGRLHFYPTFFDRIGLEVINPHPRDTGAGKQPIYFESVPAGTPGVFTLLYVPLDLVGRSTPETMEREAKADLQAVARGVRAMLTEYGFGAKTSSGYGVANVKKKDDVEIRANGIEKAEEIFWNGWEGHALSSDG